MGADHHVSPGLHQAPVQPLLLGGRARAPVFPSMHKGHVECPRGESRCRRCKSPLIRQSAPGTFSGPAPISPVKPPAVDRVRAEGKDPDILASRPRVKGQRGSLFVDTNARSADARLTQGSDGVQQALCAEIEAVIIRKGKVTEPRAGQRRQGFAAETESIRVRSRRAAGRCRCLEVSDEERARLHDGQGVSEDPRKAAVGEKGSIHSSRRMMSRLRQFREGAGWLPRCGPRRCAAHQGRSA